tara:strand:- start:21 stop:200 length:180 start_codon:yes stop_codon:yes gene_type:complete
MTKHVGSNFDEFLINEGLFHEAQTHAIKKMFVRQAHQEIEKQNLSKSKMVSNKSEPDPA